MALPKVTTSPRCVWLVDACHASSGEELGAKHTGEHTDHSPSWVQACFSDGAMAWEKAGASWHWKQKSFVYRPSNSSIIFPQTDLPAHLCLLPPLGHSGVQAAQHIQFSISWRRLPTKIPRSASCITTDKLKKANMDSDYVTAEENCAAGARKLATKVRITLLNIPRNHHFTSTHPSNHRLRNTSMELPAEHRSTGAATPAGGIHNTTHWQTQVKHHSAPRHALTPPASTEICLNYCSKSVALT
ncbi:uncharacterized protein LOC119701115 [Motacilla alba alba]|uniref:uncharacterized protein LOC119701115 n=1 Tax=Motacilla alba alba TaxID=1094192 RepID=UPI0018D514E4|nr:uncharacterized protein LOC119701115 [Motacilla alba alba]